MTRSIFEDARLMHFFKSSRFSGVRRTRERQFCACLVVSAQVCKFNAREKSRVLDYEKFDTLDRFDFENFFLNIVQKTTLPTFFLVIRINGGATGATSNTSGNRIVFHSVIIVSNKSENDSKL